ncbi:MAG: dihydropteroate synthase [Dehalococcoidia bacterium]|nr:dihydropteroate synthase [Dehalococcoidia bacterium]
MLVIGESIHVIAPRVREAMEGRDKAFIQKLARQQVAGGAHVLDLNIGPQRKTGVEMMSWMVETVQEVTDVPLSLDTTNAAAIEAGLVLCSKPALINSTDATTERLQALMPLAARFNVGIIALTLGTTGLPTSAEARIELATENILPVAEEYGVPPDKIYFDPLVLTVNGNQDQAQSTVEAVRFFKQMTDPPAMTTCGLSNISNGAPPELRSLINRVFLVMLMGAGLDTAILDALDTELMDVVRIVEGRDTSIPVKKLYVDLFDAYAAMEPADLSGVDTSAEELRNLVKTVDMLENKTMYAHGYLKV